MSRFSLVYHTCASSFWNLSSYHMCIEFLESSSYHMQLTTGSPRCSGVSAPHWSLIGQPRRGCVVRTTCVPGLYSPWQPSRPHADARFSCTMEPNLSLHERHHKLPKSSNMHRHGYCAQRSIHHKRHYLGGLLRLFRFALEQGVKVCPHLVAW